MSPGDGSESDGAYGPALGPRNRSQADPELSPNLSGLVRALRLHPPQSQWTVLDHRVAFERASERRKIAPGTEVMAVATSGGKAEWVRPASSQGDEVVLYLHGGGFIMGSLATTRPLASHLASAIHRDVLVLEYGLAPESRFPVQISQIVDCYRWLLRNGYSADQIVLAGDSAGAALALSACAQLRMTGIDGPKAAVLLSPLLDMRLTAPSIDMCSHFDPQTPRWLLDMMVTNYLGHQANRGDPLASPLLGELGDLPPTLVQVAECESLVDDARDLQRRALVSGSAVELQIWSGVIHVWHAFAPQLPEACEALDAIGTWLDHLEPSSSRVDALADRAQSDAEGSGLGKS
jgi:monoterpene epsilon-lactone hydrolase